MLIRRKSMFTGVERVREIGVDAEDYARWQLGENIQRAMPYLNAADRDFILTGVTPEEWNEAFAEVVEEDDSVV